MHYLVLELCSGGELFDNIIDNGRFSEREAANTMQQILQGIGHIHRKGVTHRGLCPENILLKNKEPIDSPRQVVKLHDFAQAARFTRMGEPTQCERSLRPFYS